jgi:hypothetical protein
MNTFDSMQLLDRIKNIESQLYCLKNLKEIKEEIQGNTSNSFSSQIISNQHQTIILLGKILDELQKQTWELRGLQNKTPRHD